MQMIKTCLSFVFCFVVVVFPNSLDYKVFYGLNAATFPLHFDLKQDSRAIQKIPFHLNEKPTHNELPELAKIYSKCLFCKQ